MSLSLHPPKEFNAVRRTTVLQNDATVGSEDVKVEPDSFAESKSSSSGSNSDISSKNGSSEESDLDKFEKAFNEFEKPSRGLDDIDSEWGWIDTTSDDVPGLPLHGGFDTLLTLANVSKTWPLARLTFPLSGFSNQLERLLESYCLEILATNTYSNQHVSAVKQFASTWCFSLHFTWLRGSLLLRQVLDHPTKVLYDSETEVVFLPQFWILPIYWKLVNTAWRCQLSKWAKQSRQWTR